MSGELFQKGKRKYLATDERAAFLGAAEKAERDVRTFCGVLHYTGCRISEALAVTVDRVDLGNKVVVLESLKKRKKGVFRAVPVPPALLDALDLVHGIRKAQKGKDGGKGQKLWSWSRTTAWRRVKEVLNAAGVNEGPNKTAKGLRHGFGVGAVGESIPLNLVQKWLGHAQLSTTAIYADAVGAEEKNIASRMWK